MFRPANISDLQTVCTIVNRAIARMESQGIDQWDDLYPDEDLLRSDIAEGFMFVLEKNQRVAGMVSLNQEQEPEYADVGWRFGGKALIVHRLTISPEFQGMGLGCEIMKFVEWKARELNFDTIRLDAFINNPAAVALYRKCSFKVAGMVHFRKGTFLCFEKSLKSFQKDMLMDKSNHGRPSFEQVYMDFAVAISRRSTCKRLQVGTVITTTDYRKVLAIGYNGNATGLPNRCDGDEPGSCGCLHAEENAAINCDSPRQIEKFVFVTNLPCPMCAKRLINLGNVRRIIFKDDYRKKDSILILEKAGIELVQLKPYL